MKNTQWIIVSIALVLVGGGSFYGGSVYGKSQGAAAGQAGGRFNDLSPEERQARMQQFGGNARAGGVNVRGAGGATSGEVISKDDKSLTLKMRDGGSKIIFTTNETRVSKMTDGVLVDIENGTQVNVTGKANQDGSVNAEVIQIRPAVIKK